MVLLRLASGRRRSISAIASESVIQDGHRQVSTALVGGAHRERKRGTVLVSPSDRARASERALDTEEARESEVPVEVVPP